MAILPGSGAWRTDRIGAGIGVAAIHLMLGYALLAGLEVSLPVRLGEDSTLTVLNLKPPPPPRPPPPKPPPKPRETATQGGGAPPPKARPLPPATAPIPAIPAPPRLIPAPPIATGSSPAGIGTGGSGAGEGSGTGSGQGEGIGNGRGFSGARQIRGRFRNSDFPASAKGAGRLKIGVRYAVGPSGTVDRCEIIQPSGYPEVDAMTCRVILERYRFKPARDDEGIPVTEVLEEDYSWRMD